jgi:hypothetical protein
MRSSGACLFALGLAGCWTADPPATAHPKMEILLISKNPVAVHVEFARAIESATYGVKPESVKLFFSGENNNGVPPQVVVNLPLTFSYPKDSIYDLPAGISPVGKECTLRGVAEDSAGYLTADTLVIAL